eukprot:TRINITY_DN2601_c0_g1_i1.p1 TRINITY_DN2601_c0_g1~~TRINITY_DN2601_c0_g1_i1.p1  ORF type:complete len:661 (+),score=98.43 TRINITY_DN2601_c0_g1_i1:136-2118(+)
MCGIFALLLSSVRISRQRFYESLLEGLKQLEYRGYDSAGIGIDSETYSEIMIFKKEGRVNDLSQFVNTTCPEPNLLFDCQTGIAHTRWATNGPPNDVNSHPHVNDDFGEFAVVHNGIITNAVELKNKFLNEGVVFRSDTDTELIPVLCKQSFKRLIKENKDVTFAEVVHDALKHVEGAFALIVKCSYYPNQLIACRQESPLLIGIDLHNKEAINFENDVINVNRAFENDDKFCINGPFKIVCASDASAIVSHTRDVVVLEEGDMLSIDMEGITFYNFYTDRGSATRSFHKLEFQLEQIKRNGHEHFMKKEIFEQGQTIKNVIRGRILDEDPVLCLDEFANVKLKEQVFLIGCGTSYHAGLAATSIFNTLLPVRCSAVLASDLLDRRIPLQPSTCIFISQSGETADTLRCMEYCRERGCNILGVTNTMGSSLTRLADASINVRAGPEIGVASTKAYTAQIAALILMALNFSDNSEVIKENCSEFANLSAKIDHLIEKDQTIKNMLEQLGIDPDFIYVSSADTATALEGALKIKEISYIQSLGLNLHKYLKYFKKAVEIDRNCLSFLILDDSDSTEMLNEIYSLLLSTSVKQKTILLSSSPGVLEKFESLSNVSVLEIPKTTTCLQSVLNIVPLQLIAYYVAVSHGINVDFPRNLAKSVTVL